MKSILPKFLYALLCAALLVATLGVTPARAASFVVNTTNDNTTNDAFCTLREAILAANNVPANANCGAGSVAADTITFSVSGTITLGSQLPDPAAGAGALTIDGTGQTVTISGANLYRVLSVPASETVTVNALTISNGRADIGSGLLNYGTLTVTNSVFSNNVVTTQSGAIVSSGTLTVDKSTFSFNTGNLGAGIFASTNQVRITNSTFNNNTAYAGAVYLVNGANFVLANNTFYNNTQANFGGFPPAANAGSAIQADNATITLVNNTFHNNTSVGAGGRIIWNNGGSFNLYNNIFGTNLGTSTGACFSTNASTGSNNLFVTTANTCGMTNGVNGNIVVDGIDPDFDTLTGTPAYYPLKSTSPAIDKGDNTRCAAAPASNQSQNGITRPKDGNGDSTATCDIGSYEFVETTAPTIAGQTLQATYIGTGPSSFTVTFSENVSNAGGGTLTDDAANPDNYVLMEQGSVSGFQTTACNNINATQDTRVTPSGVTYIPNTAIVNFGSPLPAGTYRLFVCGTTSIVDLAGNALAGNGTTSGTDFTFDFTVGAAAAAASASTTAESRNSNGRNSGNRWLPNTGFAPNVITRLPEQPAELAYTQMSDLWLEIPSQKIKANIVGVPQSENIWDVKWLGNDAGWLNGTAFPSWEGNSVLTGHVMGADGLPGPFAKLQDLNYGERIIVHMLDQQYVFEVRNKRLVRPDSTAFAFEHLEDASYLTLITCSGYNEEKNTYSFRRIIRTVLVEVK